MALLVGQLSSPSTSATANSPEGDRQETGSRTGISSATLFKTTTACTLSVGLPQGQPGIAKTYTKYNILPDVQVLLWDFFDGSDADLSTSISDNNTSLNIATTRYNIFAVIPSDAVAGNNLSLYAVPEASLAQLTANSTGYSFAIVMLLYNIRESWRKWQPRSGCPGNQKFAIISGNSNRDDPDFDGNEAFGSGTDTTIHQYGTDQNPELDWPEPQVDDTGVISDGTGTYDIFAGAPGVTNAGNRNRLASSGNLDSMIISEDDTLWYCSDYNDTSTAVEVVLPTDLLTFTYANGPLSVAAISSNGKNWWALVEIYHYAIFPGDSSLDLNRPADKRVWVIRADVSTFDPTDGTSWVIDRTIFEGVGSSVGPMFNGSSFGTVLGMSFAVSSTGIVDRVDIGGYIPVRFSSGQVVNCIPTGTYSVRGTETNFSIGVNIDGTFHVNGGTVTVYYGCSVATSKPNPIGSDPNRLAGNDDPYSFFQNIDTGLPTIDSIHWLSSWTGTSFTITQEVDLSGDSGGVFYPPFGFANFVGMSQPSGAKGFRQYKCIQDNIFEVCGQVDCRTDGFAPNIPAPVCWSDPYGTGYVSLVYQIPFYDGTTLALISHGYRQITVYSYLGGPIEYQQTIEDDQIWGVEQDGSTGGVSFGYFGGLTQNNYDWSMNSQILPSGKHTIIVYGVGDNGEVIYSNNIAEKTYPNAVENFVYNTSSKEYIVDTGGVPTLGGGYYNQSKFGSGSPSPFVLTIAQSIIDPTGDDEQFLGASLIDTIIPLIAACSDNTGGLYAIGTGGVFGGPGNLYHRGGGVGTDWVLKKAGFVASGEDVPCLKVLSNGNVFCVSGSYGAVRQQTYTTTGLVCRDVYFSFPTDDTFIAGHAGSYGAPSESDYSAFICAVPVNFSPASITPGKISGTLITFKSDAIVNGAPAGHIPDSFISFNTGANQFANITARISDTVVSFNASAFVNNGEGAKPVMQGLGSRKIITQGFL